MNIFGYISYIINKIISPFLISISFRNKKNEHLRIKNLEIDTIIDIGANKGQFLSSFLEIFPQALFHSFEPLPSAFEILFYNFSKRNNITLYNIGLGSNNGVLSMHESSFSASSSLLKMSDIHKKAFPMTSEFHITKVKVQRLDDIKINYHNLLIKIDTQGYEMEVIQGGIETIKKAKICIIETSFVHLYHNQYLFNDIYDTMIGIGFKYYGAYDQILDPNNGSVLQQDAIFLRV